MGRAAHRSGQSATGAVAVPILVKLLGASDEIVRSSAAGALGDLGPAAREALPALKKLLEDKHEDVRRASDRRDRPNRTSVQVLAGDEGEVTNGVRGPVSRRRGCHAFPRERVGMPRSL